VKALITGAEGQLGRELCRTVPAGMSVTACSRRALDIADADMANRVVSEVKPDIVINAAAYTAVDRAEKEREAAFAVNAVGAGNVARAAKAEGAWLLHVSTDFVFDGAASRAYAPDSRPGPLSVYGQSKLQGEERVREAAPDSSLIVRTSWVYSAHGANFVKTMLRLMNERDSLGVVADQVGAPTWARRLAEVIWRAAAIRMVGVQHWSDAGVASWYDFAVAIQEEALPLGLVARKAAVRPIATAEYPTPARRPQFSVLDSSALRNAIGIEPIHWRANLRAMLHELKVQTACDDSLLPAAPAL